MAGSTLLFSPCVPLNYTSDIPVTMSEDNKLYQTITETVLAHTKGYCDPHPFDNDTIQQYRTPGCLHHLHPQESIPTPFNEPIDRAMFTGFMTFFGQCLDRAELNVRDLVVDTQKHQAVVRLDAVFDFKAFAEEPALSGYTAQYMWLMDLEEDGTKVKRVEEFLDPDRLLNYVRTRAQRYAEWLESETKA